MVISISPAAIAAAVAAEIPKIFSDAATGIVGGEGEFIRAGSPASVTGRVSQAAARSACRVYGAGGVNLNASARERYERACRPYLDDFDPGAGPGVSQPFMGGQCAGTGYTVTVSGNANPPGGPGVATRNGLGPVGGMCFPDNGFGNRGIGVLFNGVCQSGGSGQASTVDSEVGSWKITSVVRDGGLPDDCGNPPPVGTPGRDIPNPTGNPFRFNPGPDIDIPITVDIGPDGDISFDIGTGPISVSPFSGGGGDNSGIITPAPGVAGQPQDTGSGNAGTGVGGEAEGEAPEGQILTGVKVDILTSPPDRVRYTTEVDRGVVYVYMGATEGLALEPTGALVRSGQFFPAQKDYFTRWQVRARLGYDIRSTPYYRDEDGTATN